MQVSSKGPYGPKVTMTKPDAQFNTGLENSRRPFPIEHDARVR